MPSKRRTIRRNLLKTAKRIRRTKRTKRTKRIKRTKRTERIKRTKSKIRRNTKRVVRRKGGAPNPGKNAGANARQSEGVLDTVKSVVSEYKRNKYNREVEKDLRERTASINKPIKCKMDVESGEPKKNEKDLSVRVSIVEDSHGITYLLISRKKNKKDIDILARYKIDGATTTDYHIYVNGRERAVDDMELLIDKFTVKIKYSDTVFTEADKDAELTFRSNDPRFVRFFERLANEWAEAARENQRLERPPAYRDYEQEMSLLSASQRQKLRDQSDDSVFTPNPLASVELSTE